MAKRLVVLVGMLAVMLAAAVPAFAQQGPVTATGVLGQPDTSGPDPEPTYPLTDEETGTTYVLISGFVELAPFVGQRVTIEGVPIGGADDAPPALNVTEIRPVDGPPPGPAPERSATFDFQLTVKGEPPADARFFGAVPAEGCISAPLADPDGDGVFTGSLDVPRFPPGPLPPEGAEPVSLPVQIVQANSGAGPCNPTTVIKDFGTVPANDDTFKARVNFKEGRGGTTPPENTTPDTTAPGGSGNSGSGGDSGSGSSGSGSSGSGSSGSGSSGSGSSGSSANSGSGSGGSGDRPSSSTGGEMKVLPRTGGALPTLGVVGALLVASGLLVRRATR